MMQRIKPYFFCRLSESDFLPFYKRVVDANGVVCFDLEDSIGDVDSNNIKRVKDLHREKVIEFIREFGSKVDRPVIGLRINSVESEFYREDLRAINSLDYIHTVFLPKMETAMGTESFLHDLQAGVADVIPVIETSGGVQALDGILSLTDSRFRAVAFGHCDYNLSLGCFPFHHQNSRKYWEWISLLDEVASSRNKWLINSPVLRLKDRILFESVLRKLGQYESASGQITLSMEQTEMCTSMPSVRTDQKELDETDIAEAGRAIEAVREFETYRLAGKMFAVDEKKDIISPQEYVAAKRHLENLH